LGDAILHISISSVWQVAEASRRICNQSMLHTIIESVAFLLNLGAIALEDARLYRTLKKDYETFRREYVATLGEQRAW